MLGRVGKFAARGGKGTGSTFSSPLDIASLKLWIDASDSDTISLAGAAVTAVVDKSTSGATLEPEEIARRPTLLTANQNGKNAFDMATGKDLVAPAPLGFTVGTGDYTIAAALRMPAVFNWNGLCQSDTYSPGWYASQSNTGNPSEASAGGAGPFASVLSAATAYVLIFKRVSGQLYVYLNGVADSDNPNASTTDVGTEAFFIGRADTDFLNGTLFEFMLFNAALSDGERANIENYLAAKWAI